MNILFPKFQSFAYCFQNSCLYAHCLIMILIIHMSYGKWIHSFTYLRPILSKNVHEVYDYIDIVSNTH